LEQEVPPSLIELLEVPDVGPKKAALFWKQAGVTNLEGLKSAALNGVLRNLPGMGEKSEKRILDGIEMVARRSKRMVLDDAWSLVNQWLEWLRSLPEVNRAEAAGSLRRWRDTIGDLDFAVASDNPARVVEAILQHPDVVNVLSRGENKTSVELKNGVALQIWIQLPQNFGCLWQFTTGSKDHNVRLRELAQRQGLSLSEQTLTREDDGNRLSCETEEQIYEALGLYWIPPELREDRGEIEAVKNGSLPNLIRLEDVHADFHMHSTWSDGRNTIEEMALSAIQNGHKVIAITDHSSGLGIAGGLRIEDIHQQRVEIDAVQQKLGDSIRILQGAEVEIRADGSLDYPDDILAELDIVIISLHTSLRQPGEEITTRLIRAMNNPHADIVGHPSARLLPNREGANLDWTAVLETAQKTGIALEINANPHRLDLPEAYARRAAQMGIPLSINSDAHRIGRLDNLLYGVSAARRAWLESRHVINTWEPEKIMTWLQTRSS
jgi:DNA polymerase (family 10)